MVLEVKPIGTILTQFAEPTGTPIQPVYAQGAEGTVEVFEPFVEGLADLEGFDRIWLLYWCDRVSQAKMRIVPYGDTQERGLFATRAPARPNPLGLSCVRLLRIAGNVLHVSDVDVLNGTPLLDIKPYVPAFDSIPVARSGWLAGRKMERTVADRRFYSAEGGRNAT